MAEAGDLRTARQVTEVAPADMHQRLVVTAFEVNVAGIAKALVKDYGNIVGGADRRDRPDIAIVEENADLIFRG